MEKVVTAHLDGRVFMFEESAYSRIANITNGQWKGQELENLLADYFESRPNPTSLVTNADITIAFARMNLQEEYYRKTNIRQLTRCSENKMIAGVCTGLGKYFNIDCVIFRVLFAVLLFCVGGGLLLYILLWIILPSDKK